MKLQEPERMLKSEEVNRKDLDTITRVLAMKHTSEEEFIAKVLRKFLPNKGITVCFIGQGEVGVTYMELGFEVGVGDRLSSAWDRDIEYFIPLSGGVVKVLGMGGRNESDPTGELMTKMIDERNHLELNLLTIIKDLK